MKPITKGIITLGTGLCMSSALATKQIVEVENFSMLSLGTGITADVQCGNNNTIELEGDSESLNRIAVEIENNVLVIKRKTSVGKIISNLLSSDDNQEVVRANITIRGQLSAVKTSTGATLSITACAVDATQLALEINTGGTVNVSGDTLALDLDMSTGSTFNHKTDNFSAQEVTVSMSTGATANLCRSNVVKGDASTGASIRVNEQADLSGLDLSLGADTSSKGCM